MPEPRKISLDNAPNIKALIGIALSRPTRKTKAELLNRAFLAGIRLHREIRDAVPVEDQARLDAISDATDPITGKGRRDEATAAADFEWIRRSYPQLAQVNDITTYALDQIGKRELYREPGFRTHNEWYAALDDEQYLEREIESLRQWEAGATTN